MFGTPIKAEPNVSSVLLRQEGEVHRVICMECVALDPMRPQSAQFDLVGDMEPAGPFGEGAIAQRVLEHMESAHRKSKPLETKIFKNIHEVPPIYKMTIKWA
jgi:hypothetical protein